jgi:hypothetical protein
MTYKISKIFWALVILIAGGCILSISCFVRLPSYFRDSSEGYVGNTYNLKRDIIIVEVAIVPISFEISEKDTFSEKKKN